VQNEYRACILHAIRQNSQNNSQTNKYKVLCQIKLNMRQVTILVNVKNTLHFLVIHTDLVFRVKGQAVKLGQIILLSRKHSTYKNY